MGTVSPNTVIIISASNDCHRDTIDRVSFMTKYVFERFDILFALLIGRNAIRGDQQQELPFLNLQLLLLQNIAKDTNDRRRTWMTDGKETKQLESIKPCPAELPAGGMSKTGRSSSELFTWRSGCRLRKKMSTERAEKKVINHLSL